MYFLAYEKLVQREIATKGIKRDQINPANAVLYGAAAGYAVGIVLWRGSLGYLLLLHSFGPSFIL